VVDERVMHRPFSRVARSRVCARPLVDAQPLRGDGTLSGSVRAFIQLMIEAEQTPTLSRVVGAAGISARNLQRQLEAGGTSFSELLADTRRSETLHRLGDHGRTIASIAAGLGYSDQASFTRAFRRWTGSPPGQFRGSPREIGKSA
jgi:AraC-like DNA-binding protein